MAPAPSISPSQEILAFNTALVVDDAGENLIMASEGVVLRAYADPGTGGSPWTIGVGHTSAAGLPNVVPGMVITRQRAMDILAADLKAFSAGVAKLVTQRMSQGECNAFNSFSFNVGLGNFRGSSVLAKFNAGDTKGAADAFLLWTKAAGRVLPGLVDRRRNERTMFLDAARTIDATPLPEHDEQTGVMLRVGSPFPEAIKPLQADLITLGLLAPPADGVFGRETDKAVRRFQSAQALTVDGRVGPATRASIAHALAVRGKPQALAYHPLPGQALDVPMAA